MDLGLRDLHVVITGGSKGIGFACAEGFVAEGARVTLCARDSAALAEAANHLGRGGGQVDTIVADLSHNAERERLFASARDANILVNNAGAIRSGDLFSIPTEAWQADWQLKVFGYIHLAQLFLARMRAQRAGVVVNVIGMASRAPRWGYVCGAAGNAALVAFTHAVGAESPRWGVRVFGVNPGPTRTERRARLTQANAAREGERSPADEASDMPFGRLTEPTEIGDLCVMLASPRAAYLSGTVIDVDGGSQFHGPP
jgi:3-oxoacyl-[acyl-carrier protein] reductase